MIKLEGFVFVSEQKIMRKLLWQIRDDGDGWLDESLIDIDLRSTYLLPHGIERIVGDVKTS